MNENIENNNFCIGRIELSKSKAILNLFEKSNIKFELEVDDSQIKNLTPLEAQGGTFGLGIYVDIFISPKDEEVSLKILNQFNELKENINLNYKSTMVRFSMLFFEGMVASSGALLGTFIPVAYHFHEMSLIGIFFNIIIIPLTFLMVIFGIITIIILLQG